MSDEKAEKLIQTVKNGFADLKRALGWLMLIVSLGLMTISCDLKTFIR